MIWLVTEDSNSARDFWTRVFEVFAGSSGYKLNPLKMNNGVVTAGNKTLNNQVKEVLQKAKENDTLFVVLDNIANTKQFVAADFIRNTANKCKKHNVKFYCTKYYCFEELYISYAEVERLYSIKHQCDLNTLKSLQYTRKCIMNGIDYYDKQKNEVQHIITINSDANKNREHFANALISEVTKGLGYAFWFSKKGKHSSKSECWTIDCITIQDGIPTQQKNKVCDIQCKYCCKDKLAKEKFLHLEANSMMKFFGKTFEDLATDSMDLKYEIR